jgi:hypothetical protein
MRFIKLTRTARTFALVPALLVGMTMSVAAGARDTSLGPAPGSCRVLAMDGVIEIPFDVYRGDIRFRAEVNGHPVHLLLDDGSMWDQLLFWGGPETDALGLEYDEGQATIGDPSGESAITSRMASGISLRLPGVEFTDQTALITPYSSGVSKMWQGSVGQVSATVFKHFVVDIDFDEMVITLIEPEKFEYHGGGVAIAWKPLGFGPWAIPARLELADGRSVSLDLMMDLGYNDQLEISTTGEHEIAVPQRALPAVLGRNIQGEATLGHLGRLRSVHIGGYEVEDVLASFVSEEQSDDTFSEVMVGLGLLSRFNLVYDHSRQRLFVEPNRSFTDPFEHDMSGMVLAKGEGGYLTATRVHEDSPARRAGVREGDRVKTINGRPAGEFDLWELQPLMRRKGETVTLVVERGNEELQVEIKLRRVI